MKAKVKLNTKSGESKSMNHSTSQTQIIVRTNNNTWEIGNVLMAFVQFQKSFFSFILIIEKIKIWLIWRIDIWY